MSAPQSPPKWISNRSAPNFDRYHYRKSSESRPTPEPTFSFRQNLEKLLTSESIKTPVMVKPEDLGYSKEEVYSTKENLPLVDLNAYSEKGENAFLTIPLLPPPEDLCY